MALLTWAQWRQQAPDKSNQVLNHLWCIKGVGVDEVYVMEVDPATGGIPFSFAASYGWGPVDATTLRTASILGNEDGQADFGAGATTAQTLRVAVASDSPFSLSYDTDYGTVGVDTLRTAAQIGNAAGEAAFGTGIVGADVLRTTLVTDVDVPIRPLDDATDSVTAFQGGIWAVDAAQSGAWTVDAVQSGTWDVGITGTVPLPTGAATAANQVLEIADLDAINTATAAIAVSTASLDGKTVVVDTGNVTVVSSVLPTGAATAANQVLEIADLDAIKVSAASIDGKTPGLGQALAAASVPVVLASNQPAIPVTTGSGAYVTSTITEFATTALSTSAWTQIVASTGAVVNNLSIFMSSGTVLELGIGGSGSEVRKLLISPGAFDCIVPLNIPASSRVSLRVVTMTGANPVPNTGFIAINFLG